MAANQALEQLFETLRTSCGEYAFLDRNFLKAMNDIGRHGHEKYGDDPLAMTERKPGQRWTPDSILDHAKQHADSYRGGIPHDHFQTRKHQLAAVAFNAMMEFYFAGLDDEV
jgi:hypothetical protein